MTTLFDLRKINQNDKNEFMTMSRDFYNSDAVSAPVPENFHEQAFSDLMAGTPYAECLFFTHENQVAGFALLAKTYSREAGGECVWVEELYLKPEFRGMGAAKRFSENCPLFTLRQDTASKWNPTTNGQKSCTVRAVLLPFLTNK